MNVIIIKTIVKMNSTEFLKIINTYRKQAPFIESRIEFTRSQANNIPLEIFQKDLKYFYSELVKAKAGEQNIFRGKFEKLNIQDFNGFGYLENLQCILKITYKEFEEFEKIIDNLIPEQGTGTPAPKPVLRSFESTMSVKQLKKLFAKLKSSDIKFIHSETSFEQFAAILRAEATETIEPVKWLKYKPQLFYLLNGLIVKNNLVEPNSLYKTIEICFTDKQGNPFKNLKQSYNTFKNVTDNCRHSEILTEIIVQINLT
jgi:hypothetical protein